MPTVRLGESETATKHVDWDKLPLLPEGSYIVRVSDVIETQSKDGSTQFWVELKARGQDERLSDHLTFNEKSKWRIEQCLRSLGVDVSGADEFDVTPDLLRGRCGEVSVLHEEWGGKTKAGVKEWLAWDAVR
jgi:hypothetical protein